MERFLYPLLLLACAFVAPAREPLRVGVTLHPYYSWVANIVAGTDVEVRAILPGEVDAGSYQPSPDDVRKLVDLDALVVNGIGHDDFVFDMLRASGNEDVVVIRPNEAVPLLGGAKGEEVNSHTFLSFTNAIQQTYAIQRALSALRPELDERFRENAAAYAKRLRIQRAKAAQELAEAEVTRVVTVHDGYAYLMQELGIEVAGVVEPAHGLVPSVREMQAMVELVRREGIRVVFSEESFPEPLLAALRDETEARVHVLSHVATGPYTPDKFEVEMAENVRTMVEALVRDPRGS